jgi:hypothetical protein
MYIQLYHHLFYYKLPKIIISVAKLEKAEAKAEKAAAKAAKKQKK